MITPKTEAALVDAIKTAKGPLCVKGGGTRPIGGLVDGDPLSTRGLSGIELYEPGAMTLVAKAGTSVEEIEAQLAAENQQLAFEPMDHRTLLGTNGTPTIGGIVAANVSGPRRMQVGACRDHLLGVRFVDGAGQEVANGGRVMKNVTGYDLVKLMAGSRGTLGVLTEVSLKVMPRAETSATLCLSAGSLPEGLAAMTAAMNSPFDVSGASHIGESVYLRVEGFEGSVVYRLSQLQERLGGEKVQDDAQLWRDIRDVVALKGHPYVWKVNMVPSALYDGLLAKVLNGLEFDRVIDWAGGCAWIGLTETQAGSVEGGALGFHAELHSAVIDPNINGSAGGHATLIKGPDDLKGAVSVFQPEPAPLAALSTGLRRKFDPRGILNPGLMG